MMKRRSSGVKRKSMLAMRALMQTLLPLPVVPATRQMRHLREIGDDRFAVNIFAEGDRQFRASLASSQSSDCSSSRRVTFTLRLLAISIPTVSLPGMGARMLIRSARVARAQVALEANDLVHAHALGWINFVAGDRRAFGDVAGRDRDPKLAEGFDQDLLNVLSTPPGPSPPGLRYYASRAIRFRATDNSRRSNPSPSLGSRRRRRGLAARRV